ncbi:MAG: hypothetical protein LUE14_07835 [Clostridiales bacterium]|nr:hypothetical protein [Clostridiales bacterium]
MAEYKDIKDFLVKTHKADPRSWEYPWIPLLAQRPRITCRDGFSFSVQASSAHYCSPRIDNTGGNYSSCEVGVLSREEDLLMDFAENPVKSTKTVYCYVPVSVIDSVIEKHGGFA